MASQRQWLIELVKNIVRDESTAVMVVDALISEGVVQTGYGDRDVDAITTKFMEVFGNTKTTKFDRFAARRLAEAYGAQSVTGIIQLMGQFRDTRYAPSVGSVSQLEDKWVQVMNFLRKQRGDEVIDV